MKKYLSLILIGFAVFMGLNCSSGLFMEENEIKDLDYTSYKFNHTIYYKCTVIFNTNNTFRIIEHRISKIKDKNNISNLLQAFDGEMSKLLSFDVKIIKKDETITFSKGKAIKVSLSGRDQLTQNKFAYMPITDLVKDGDMLETLIESEFKFPELGSIFSISEAGLYADNIICEYHIPNGLNITNTLINDKIEPDIIYTSNEKIETYKWAKFIHDENPSVFSKTNKYPTIVSSIVKDWSEYGNFYYNLIKDRFEIDASVVQKAKDITKDCVNEREKLNAIFNYCQSNIRYEISYLEYGEIIPNDCKVILERNYGDCKDYSIAIHNLAKSVGINTNLVLVRRGRGVEFYENPVSQFNHMLVYCCIDGEDCWYDGTDRTGIPGIVNDDLINQNALIISESNSFIKTIKESDDNLLNIKGVLSSESNNLTGDLELTLSSQYAISFRYMEKRLNNSNYKDYIKKWLKNNFNGSIEVINMKTQSKDDCYIIEINCKIPNSVLNLDKNVYTSYSKILPNVFPYNERLNENDVFYYPYYNYVNIDLKIYNSITKIENLLQQKITLSAGPFKENKSTFIRDYDLIKNLFNRNIKLD